MTKNNLTKEERTKFLQGLSDDFKALRENPEAWQEYQKEMNLWDKTLSDGLSSLKNLTLDEIICKIDQAVKASEEDRIEDGRKIIAEIKQQLSTMQSKKLREEIQKGLDDLEAGRYKTFSSSEELKKFFDEIIEKGKARLAKKNQIDAADAIRESLRGREFSDSAELLREDRNR